jgi:hypothetical protein
MWEDYFLGFSMPLAVLVDVTDSPVTERWIILNACYMFLGVKSRLFEHHLGSGVITVSQNVYCRHMSSGVIRSVLKTLAEYGTVVNQIRVEIKSPNVVYSPRKKLIKSLELFHSFIETYIADDGYCTLIDLVADIRAKFGSMVDLLAFVRIFSTPHWRPSFDDFCEACVVSGTGTELVSDCVRTIGERALRCAFGKEEGELAIIIQTNVPEWKIIRDALDQSRIYTDHTIGEVEVDAESVLVTRFAACSAERLATEYSRLELRRFLEDANFENLTHSMHKIIFCMDGGFVHSFLTKLTPVGPLREYVVISAFNRALSESGYEGWPVRVALSCNDIDPMDSLRFRLDDDTLDEVDLRLINIVHKSVFRLVRAQHAVSLLFHEVKRRDINSIQLRNAVAARIDNALHAVWYDILEPEWRRFRDLDFVSITQFKTGFREYLQRCGTWIGENPAISSAESVIRVVRNFPHNDATRINDILESIAPIGAH